MYDLNISGIANIIEKLNTEICDQLQDFEYGIDLLTNGSDCKIEFLGVFLWGNNDEDREFYEKDNEYEPLEGFLRRRINRLINKFGCIRL